MSNEFDISRRKALAALGTIGAASAGAGLGTSAYFSDGETFENNRLVAGTLDVGVSYSAHYSNWSSDEAEGVPNVRMWNGEAGTTGDADDLGPDEVGLPSNAAWLVAVSDDDDGDSPDPDLDVAERFLDNTQYRSYNGGMLDCVDGAANSQANDAERPVVGLDDLKPGDFGEVTFDFVICDNPGFVWLTGALQNTSENGVTDPEGDDPDEGEGVELLDTVQAAVWVDDGNNLQNGDEEPVVIGSLRDVLGFGDRGGTGTALNGALPASQGGGVAGARNCFSAATVHSVAFAWWVPVDHGNEIQSDSATFDLGLYTEQCRHNQGEGISEFPEEVATQFVNHDAVDLPSDAVIYFGQVPPGTVIEEPPPTLSESPNSLTVPSTSGSYYMFYVDPLPKWGFSHLVQYAWLNPTTGTLETTQAQWPPLLTHDDSLLQHSFQSRREVEGVDFVGGGQPQRILLQDSGQGGNQGKPQPSAPQACTDCYALVMDMGDLGVADVMAHEADQIAEWFDEGWHVQRVSQYWGNDHPAFATTAAIGLGAQLNGLLDNYAQLFEECCQRRKNTEGGDDASIIDFFVYIKAHAHSGEFSIYPPFPPLGFNNPAISDGVPAQRIHPADTYSYDALFDSLNGGGPNAFIPKVPTDCVRFTVFIDACQSDSARAPFAQHLSEYREPTVLITTAEDGMVAYFDEGGSATAHFNGADDQDYEDDDSQTGELGDRTRHAQEEAGSDSKSQNPQVHSNGGGGGVSEITEDADAVGSLELPVCGNLNFNPPKEDETQSQ